MTAKYSGFIEKDKFLDQRNQEILTATNKLAELNERYKQSIEIHTSLENEINLYKDTLEIGSIGLYEPQFDFATSEQYKSALEINYDKQKNLIKMTLQPLAMLNGLLAAAEVRGKR